MYRLNVFFFNGEKKKFRFGENICICRLFFQPRLEDSISSGFWNTGPGGGIAVKGLKFIDIIDIKGIQHLMDLLYRVTCLPVGITEPDGTMLLASGCTAICGRFHLAHPASREICRRHNEEVANHIHEPPPISLKCSHGLWHNAIPVLVNRDHLATIFLGQFLLNGEVPNREFFVSVAGTYGYNEKEYLEALDEVPVYTKDGIRDMDEDAELVIVHGAQKVFIGSIRVKSEESVHDVRYDSFVIGNGNYEVSVSLDGQQDSATYVAAFVPTLLNVTIEEVVDPGSGTQTNVVQVTPIYINENLSKGFWIQNYEDDFIITARITDPDGILSETTMSMGELPGNYSERFELTGDIMGEYRVSVSLENRLVKSSSAYRTLEPEGGEIVRFVNKRPQITELRSLTSRPKINQEMEISVKAIDVDDNGGLTVFFIDWGEEDGDLQQINVSGNPQSIKAKHTYTAAGLYLVTVSVADNGPYYPSRPEDSYVRYAAKDLEVQVFFI